MAESQNCSKCGSDLDTTGYPKWCKDCRAKYKREYESVRYELAEKAGFAAGAAAFRENCARLFDGPKVRGGYLKGQEIANVIRQCPAPVPEGPLPSQVPS